MGASAFAEPTYTVFTDTPVGGSGTTIRYGINDMGGYAGWFMNSGTYLGFMHDGSGFSTVGPTSPVGTYATGINNSNDVVGYYYGTTGFQGFIEKSGVYSGVNYPNARSTVVYGMNDTGQVVGYYTDASGVTHGFVESAGVYTSIDVPGAVATYVMGINDSGEIVGSYFDGTETHAFIDNAGTFTSIDFPGAPVTFASSINSAGVVVGWYETCPGCPQIGFIRDTSGAYTSIAPMPGIPTYLTGINDSNEILVAILGATNPSQFGTNFGMLLSGVAPTTEMPEPGTLVLMATGGVLLLALRRLRRRSSLV